VIHWFEPPYKGTNTRDGFEVIIHGLAIIAGTVRVLCVGEDGVLADLPLSAVAMDWRHDRQRGWFSIDDPAQD